MKARHEKDYTIRAAKRKFLHELERKQKRRSRRRAGYRRAAGPVIHEILPSPLISFLRSKFQGESTATFDQKNSQWVIPIPPVFSFIRNPDETLNTIFSLVEIFKASAERSVFFDHSQLKEIDMGASIVLDVVAMNVRREWQKHGLSYRFGGQFPKNALLCEFLKTMGITKHLNVRGAEPSGLADKLFVRFPLHTGFKQVGSELGGAQHREKAASHLVHYINDCLQKVSTFTIKDEGQSLILKWAGEIITNAEEHSGHRQWYAIGCMTPRLSGTQGEQDTEEIAIGECQLTVFGFGASIFESLSSPDTPLETRQQLTDLAAKHTGFFNKSEKYSDKDLWTLYALQDGVSRFSVRPGESTRGKGTVEMIEAFQRLGCSVDPRFFPEMSLISGSTRIYFNNKYHLKEEEVYGGKRKIIAFNQKNSLAEKPDSTHVHSLAGHFPGTLLTFKFFIDDRYLDRVYAAQKAANATNA